MEKYHNKYLIPSARLQTWNYKWAGAYFITICTQNRIHYFGEIVKGKMVLSHIGVIADILWHGILNHSKNTELGSFVVMPNHIHCILILTKNIDFKDINNDNDDIKNYFGTGNDNGDHNDIGDHNVETGHALSLQSPQSPQSPQSLQLQQTFQTMGQQRFQNIGKNSISSVIGSYKSAISKHAHRLGFDFFWQSRFYDHIIRNNAEYQSIRDYIENNPQNWKNDKFFQSDQL